MFSRNHSGRISSTFVVTLIVAVIALLECRCNGRAAPWSSSASYRRRSHSSGPGLSPASAAASPSLPPHVEKRHQYRDYRLKEIADNLQRLRNHTAIEAEVRILSHSSSRPVTATAAAAEAGVHGEEEEAMPAYIPAGGTFFGKINSRGGDPEDVHAVNRQPEVERKDPEDKETDESVSSRVWFAKHPDVDVGARRNDPWRNLDKGDVERAANVDDDERKKRRRRRRRRRQRDKTTEIVSTAETGNYLQHIGRYQLPRSRHLRNTSSQVLTST